MDNKPSQVKACMINLIFKTLYILTSIVTVSIGLAFYFLVPGTVGYGVGIAMFIATALIFVAGELAFYMNMGKIKMID